MSTGPTPTTPPASASAARPRRPPGTPLLEVRDLVTRFSGPRGSFDPVAGVSFRLAAGETLGLVGESGCGKTLTALSLLRLLPKPGRIAGGQVRLEGQDLVALPEAARSERLVQWTAAPDARECHPREEHLLPLMVVAGAVGLGALATSVRSLLRSETRADEQPVLEAGGVRERVVFTPPVRDTTPPSA